jgi:hypothetical protein
MKVNSDLEKCKVSDKCSLKMEIDTKVSLETMSLGEKAECFQEMVKCKVEFGRKAIFFLNCEYLYLNFLINLIYFQLYFCGNNIELIFFLKICMIFLL